MHNTKRKGFTLIELLVVVLIIGILASVALPQYTKAVEKSRAAEGLAILKYMRTQGEVYMLANGGVCSEGFESTGIELSGNFKYYDSGIDEIACNKYWCFSTNSVNWGDDAPCYPDAPMARRYVNGDPEGELLYSLEYGSNYSGWQYKNQIVCTDDAKNYCKMFGTTSGKPIK